MQNAAAQWKYVWPQDLISSQMFIHAGNDVIFICHFWGLFRWVPNSCAVWVLLCFQFVIRTGLLTTKSPTRSCNAIVTSRSSFNDKVRRTYGSMNRFSPDKSTTCQWMTRHRLEGNWKFGIKQLVLSSMKNHHPSRKWPPPAPAPKKLNEHVSIRVEQVQTADFQGIAVGLLMLKLLTTVEMNAQFLCLCLLNDGDCSRL